VCKSRAWRAREIMNDPAGSRSLSGDRNFEPHWTPRTLTRVLWQSVEQQPERCHMLVDLSPRTPPRTAFSVMSLR
jgi:hypothetical protein